MQFSGMLPEPSDQSRDRNRGRTVTSRPFLLPFDCHDGPVATVLPPPHAAFASLPPPLIPQPLPSAISMPIPLPLIAYAPKSYPSLAPPSVSLPYPMPSVSMFAPQSFPNAAAEIAWDAVDRDTLLKAASRQRFTKVFGSKIRAFLADAELFFTLCSCPRDRWGYFVLAWLGPDEAEKIRRSHVADSIASYEKFCEKLIALFERFEFDGAYRATLRGLRQSRSESVAAYAAQTTDLCSHALAEF